MSDHSEELKSADWTVSFPAGPRRAKTALHSAAEACWEVVEEGEEEEYSEESSEESSEELPTSAVALDSALATCVFRVFFVWGSRKGETGHPTVNLHTLIAINIFRVLHC